MIKSNKILCIVGAILIAFVGLFGFIFATQDDRIVKADEVVVSSYFNSSNIINSVGLSANSNDISNITFNTYVDLQFNFFVSNTSNSIAGQFLNIRARYADSSSYLDNNTQINYDNWENLSAYARFNAQTGNYSKFYYMYYCPSSFNVSTIYKVVISSYSPAFGSSSRGATSYVYYDSNDVGFEIQICYLPSSSNSNVLSSRTYFLSNVSTLTDNQYYQAGLQEGLNNNQSNIFDEGYQKALDDNKEYWINYGRQQGIADANDYTLLGLIGATIDAPISALFGRLDTNPDSPTYNQYIGGFFNFELLGVNLRSFFFAILTFALIILIIRFALAR